jgi:hypothetical protein
MTPAAVPTVDDLEHAADVLSRVGDFLATLGGEEHAACAAELLADARQFRSVREELAPLLARAELGGVIARLVAAADPVLARGRAMIAAEARRRAAVVAARRRALVRDTEAAALAAELDVAAGRAELDVAADAPPRSCRRARS